LGARGINELHVEAVEKLNGSFLRAGLVDELLVYQAPRLLGEGAPLAALGTLTSLEASIDFAWIDVTRVGADLRLRLRDPGVTAALRGAVRLPPVR
ncbi:MAG: RibD family protein, partial [Steroidobacteraceae bacterium]